IVALLFFFSSRRRHTRSKRDWSSDVCSSDLDKTQRYWFVTFAGYAINMLAVPALALAGQWPLAAGLVVAERTGRAIRKPVVEAKIGRASCRERVGSAEVEGG